MRAQTASALLILGLLGLAEAQVVGYKREVVKGARRCNALERAQPGDTIFTDVVLTLVDSEDVIWATEEGKPFDVILGYHGLILGWELGIPGMCVGETIKLTLPPFTAYGTAGAGESIPPNTSLTFVITLANLTKGKPLARSAYIGETQLQREIVSGVENCHEMESVQPGDSVTLQYEGRLLATNEVFSSADSMNYTSGGSYVNMGFDLGIIGACEGETIQLIVPPSMGFGSAGKEENKIPPDATLLYTVTVGSIQKGRHSSLNLPFGEIAVKKELLSGVPRCDVLQRAQPGDKVTVLYEGKLAEDGKVFDVSEEDKPFSYIYGETRLILGWELGFLGTCEGDKVQMTLPWEMAYGNAGAGDVIPPKSDLIFTVTLEKLEKAPSYSRNPFVGAYVGMKFLSETQLQLTVVDPVEDCDPSAAAWPGDTITITYEAKLASNHEVFESSSDPVTFLLGERALRQIDGIEIGIMGICESETIVLVIPPTMTNNGKDSSVPTNATLIYTITVVDIDKSSRSKRSISLEPQLQREVLNGVADCNPFDAALPGDTVTVSYEGRLAANNKLFDSTDGGDPITFKLGENRVIQGWEKGLKSTCKGETIKLTIPPELGYGEKGAGEGVIPPFATLIFTLTLEDLDKAIFSETFRGGNCPEVKRVLELDEVFIYYTARLTNGSLVQSTPDNEPLKFTVGKSGIAGWDEAVKGACLGEKRRVVVPSRLAYGSDGVAGLVPPNANLVLDVEIVRVNQKSPLRPKESNPVLGFLDRISSGTFNAGR